MAKTFRVSLYTPQEIANRRTARTLWSLLGDPLIDPQRFDSVERAKNDFTPDGYNRAGEIYENEGVLFVRGSKDSFTAMFMRQHGGWSVWNFWWDAKVMMNRKRDAWLNWLFELCKKLPVFYGFGCTVAEYDAKHTVVEEVPGGTATRTVGATAANFYEFLPGLYWLSIFGPQLTDHFKEKMKSIDQARTVELDSAGIALILNEPAVPEDMDERLRNEAQLSNLLGTKYFFDRTQEGINYQPVPELADALHELRN